MAKAFLMLILAILWMGCTSKPTPETSECIQELSLQGYSRYPSPAQRPSNGMVAGYITGRDLTEFWEIQLSLWAGKPSFTTFSLGKPCLDQGENPTYNAPSSDGLLRLEQFGQFLWIKQAGQDTQEVLLPSVDPTAAAARLELKGNFFPSNELRSLASKTGLY